MNKIGPLVIDDMCIEDDRDICRELQNHYASVFVDDLVGEEDSIRTEILVDRTHVSIDEIEQAFGWHISDSY